MQVVVREPSSSSSRYTEESENTIRPSHSSSHRDSKSSHRDSHTSGHGSQKTALYVKGNKSATGGSLLRRATTAAAAASRHPETRETARESSSHHHSGQSSRGHSGVSSSSHYSHSSRDQPSQKTAQELQQRRSSHHSHAKNGGPGLHTRLENIEEGLKKMRVSAEQPRQEASPATSVTKIVIVRDAPRLVLPGSTQYAMAQAYRAGLNDGRYGL